MIFATQEQVTSLVAFHDSSVALYQEVAEEQGEIINFEGLQQIVYYNQKLASNRKWENHWFFDIFWADVPQRIKPIKTLK